MECSVAGTTTLDREWYVVMLQDDKTKHKTKTTKYHNIKGGRRGGDRMVVGFIITNAISAYHY
jgi:hypothetical protein